MDETIDQIVSVFHPNKIIIFGSVARNSAHDESDLDILVVMNSELKPTKRAEEVYKATSSIDLPMDIIVLTPEEYEANKDNPHSFASVISKTGIVAYESDSIETDLMDF